MHERNVDSDFLLIILRDLLRRRSSLRVILMSATMNADLFADYFTLTSSSSSVRAPPGLGLGGGGGGRARDVPVMHIPGYTYPVRVNWLADALEYTGCSSEALQTKSSGRGRS